MNIDKSRYSLRGLGVVCDECDEFGKSVPFIEHHRHCATGQYEKILRNKNKYRPLKSINLKFHFRPFCKGARKGGQP